MFRAVPCCAVHVPTVACVALPCRGCAVCLLAQRLPVLLCVEVADVARVPTGNRACRMCAYNIITFKVFR